MGSLTADPRTQILAIAKLSAQAEAVLGMALRRLTSMETGRLQAEHAELTASIASLKDLLRSEEAIKGTVAREARELVSPLGNGRQTLVCSFMLGELPPQAAMSQPKLL